MNRTTTDHPAYQARPKGQMRYYGVRKLPSFKSTRDFYRTAIELLQEENIPFLVGGAFALREYTGVVRDTKDFDLCMCRSDVDRALEAFRTAGYHADYAYKHWLAKIRYGEAYIDLLYRAGNGLCCVDPDWFDHSRTATVMGATVQICPPEEMLWMKAYIMERERFDGADVVHLLLSCGEHLDWDRLLARFGDDWEVLLAHLVLFRYSYPGERESIPRYVMKELTRRLLNSREDTAHPLLCRGTLLSREQYLPDIERWGYDDARREGRTPLTEEEIRDWTNAIGAEE
jgi:hypothetical protein